jgi:hypothetical protein
MKIFQWYFAAGLVISAVDYLWMAKKAGNAIQHGQMSMSGLNRQLKYRKITPVGAPKAYWKKEQ